MALVWQGNDLGWVDDGTGGNQTLGTPGGQEWTPPTAVTPTPAGAPASGPSTSMWDYAKAQNTGFNYTPQQLGWDDTTAQRFGQAGISQLPGWFNKDLIMSDQFHLGSHDPIQNYIDFYTTPMDQAVGQWDAAKNANQFLLSSGGTADDPAFKEAYLRQAFGNLNNAKDSWWDRNKGWVIGAGGVASIAAGGLAAELGLLGEGAIAGGEAGAAGAGAGGGLSGLEIGADLGYSASQLAPGGMAGGIAGGSASAGSWLGDAIATGTAAGADVGMGAGTSWLTDLGLPASYGNDLGALISWGGDQLAGLDWGSLAKSGLDIGNLIGGGNGLVGAGTQPVNIMSGGGTTSAPQTSQITQGPPMGMGTPVAPATMPTGSIMSAYGYRNSGKDDYKKYFSNLF